MPVALSPRSPSWREIAWLSLCFLASAAPFLARPIHLDEPVFVWVAEQVSRHPLDFYGFEINWTGSALPVHQVMMNPPLASYLIAGAAALVGWSATALHAAFTLPALAALLGTLALAARWSARPLLAGLAVLWTPAFLVSSTLLMSDVLAVALWVWALVFWESGLRKGSFARLAAAGCLAGLCALAEYFGIALLALLALYAALQTRRAGAWLAALAPAVALPGAYHFYTQALYGEGLLFAAGDWAGSARLLALADLPTLAAKLGEGLAFTGGCAASALALAPLMLSRRQGLAWGLGALLLAAALLGGGRFGPPWVALQVAFWSSAGLGVLALALADARAARDPEALLLLAWVAGTFVFAAFLNWTVNARGLLPLIPAVGILIARRIERRARAAGAEPSRRRLVAGLAAAAALALATAWADARLAASAQLAAQTLVRDLVAGGERVWYQGHWGFQFYAEREGARAFDSRGPQPAPGELVVVPRNTSYPIPLPRELFERERRVDLAVPRWISTMNPASGAAFYAASFGPLPFAFGGAAPERYLVYRAKAP
jgi:hypothetical protein